MPGLSFEDWQRDFPTKPYPIAMGIDRRFPARYEVELQRTIWDSTLLARLGLDEFWQEQVRHTLQDAPWFPIADNKEFEDKCGTLEDSLGGHPVPSHGYLFGYRADYME